jgi:regulator of replication initiation timing
MNRLGILDKMTEIIENLKKQVEILILENTTLKNENRLLKQKLGLADQSVSGSNISEIT